MGLSASVHQHRLMLLPFAGLCEGGDPLQLDAQRSHSFSQFTEIHIFLGTVN